jgi:hypothetical protein
MKKLLTLKKCLVAAGLSVAVLGISAGSAFAANSTTQAARASVEKVGTWGFNPVNGPSGTVTFNSFVTNTLNPTTGDLTTMVHLQGAAPNTTYFGNIYSSNAGWPTALGTSVRIVTNGQGNGDGVAVNNNNQEIGYGDVINSTSQITVEMFNTGYTSFLQSVFAPVTVSAS